MENGISLAGAGEAVWVVGDHYTMKATGDDTGGTFALIEVLVPPRRVTKAHS